VVAALSTEHQVGLLVVAGLFIAFALLSSFVFPRYWPQYPGARGLGAFIVASITLFVAMMLAVELFAIEEEEAEARDEPAAVEETTTTTTAETSPATTEAAETETTTTTTTTTAAPQTVTVSGTEFAFALNPSDVRPGVVVFRLENDGQIAHDLKVEGPGVEDEKTPVIDPGQTADVRVELQEGDYELYCTVPGHREGGMEVDLKVA
jgi:uncharacterized cupredoxin-like copper-binding protein